MSDISIKPLTPHEAIYRASPEACALTYEGQTHDQIKRAFQCKNKAEFIKQFIEHNSKYDNYIIVFQIACKYDYIEIVQWLIREYPNSHDCWPGLGKNFGGSAFINACENGHLHMAKLLIERFPEYQYVMNRALLGAIDNGHLHIVMWLIKRFPNINPRAQDDYVFRMACYHGHLHIVKWLIKRFPDINPRAQDNYAFRMACYHGHLHIVQWLKTTFPDINHRACDDYAFRKACFNGYFRIAQWLKTTFPDINHHANNDEVLHHAQQTNDIPLLQWLQELD